MGQRKLQIFLSSTYEDLIDERLAAMEAILAAGHIPAAMEQFTPGDETAWEKIKRWIDESDAYILILGARYGSLEPISGKSYVHLEYDYALAQKKPFMSLVITDKGIDNKVASQTRKILEQKNEAKYRDFKELVTKSHCGFWGNQEEIQAQIYRKLPEWNQRPDLKGWVRAEEAASPEAVNELARLSSENHSLREQLKSNLTTFDGLNFDQFVDLLYKDKAIGDIDEKFVRLVGSKPENAGHLFDALMDALAARKETIRNLEGDEKSMIFISSYARELIKHNLVEYKTYADNPRKTFYLSNNGRMLRNQLLFFGDREKRYRELWHVTESEIPSTQS